MRRSLKAAYWTLGTLLVALLLTPLALPAGQWGGPLGATSFAQKVDDDDDDDSAIFLPATRPRGTAIEIASPKARQSFAAVPVSVEVIFNEPVDPTSFKAILNRVDVSSEFTLSATQATGSLGNEDGVDRRNRLRVSARALGTGRMSRASVRFFVEMPKGPTTTAAVITQAGGQIGLTDVGAVVFPLGAFPSAEVVELATTSEMETASSYTLTTPLFRAGPRLPYEVRVRASRAPDTPFEVRLNISAAFLAEIPQTAQPAIFARIHQESSLEVLYNFGPFPGSFDPAMGVLSATLPPWAFTDLPTAGGGVEAVLLVGTIPRPPSTSAIGARLVLGEPTSFCPPGGLAPPLDPLPTPSDPFSRAPLPDRMRPHYGVDYPVADGTEVLAMAAGVVRAVGFSSDFGNFIIIQHDDDRSASLYAHLQPGTFVDKDDRVGVQQPLGRSDNTGRSTGAHLHVEYSTTGLFPLGGGGREDPSSCLPAPPVLSVIPGSIDFGSVAVGNSAHKTFTVKNTGGGILQGSATTSTPFSIVSGATYNLAAGQSQTVTVRFGPTSVGTFVGAVTFTGGDGATKIVTGTAAAVQINITRSACTIESEGSTFLHLRIQASGNATGPTGSRVFFADLQWFDTHFQDWECCVRLVGGITPPPQLICSDWVNCTKPPAASDTTQWDFLAFVPSDSTISYRPPPIQFNLVMFSDAPGVAGVSQSAAFSCQ